MLGSRCTVLRRVTVKLRTLNMSGQGDVGKRGMKVLTLDTLNPNIKKMEYAVRGPIVARAAEIEQELANVCLIVKNQNEAIV